MRSTYIKVFKNYNLLTEMLELRKSGNSYPALGEKYGVDHTSIIYQCQKYSVHVGMTNVIMVSSREKAVRSDRGVGRPTTMNLERQWVHQGTEKVNAGHSYKEYMEIQKRMKESFISRMLNSPRI